MKFVYLFSEATGLSRDLLGGKGFGLVEMTSMGLPVPPGFVITTEACKNYYENGQKLSEELKTQILDAINRLEKITKKKFYKDGEQCDLWPLFLSARSGAKVSMPGMMDTILNIGVTRESLEFISNETGDSDFSHDIYLRFLQMFSDVYAKISKEEISDLYDKSGEFEDKVKKIKEIYKFKTGFNFPDNPYDQLILAVEAVFKSWNNPRAIYYRKMNNISEDSGTAVTIQMMVFGNYKENSGTGVAFTRNPTTGEKHIFGEYLMNAQGEDVVAGIRTPSRIDNLKVEMPEVYEQFVESAKKLENHFNDMQDMEFTIEKGKLYILQTRNGKRSPAASVKIAMDLLKEEKISELNAINMVSEKQIQSLLHPYFKKDSLKNAKIIAKGLPASPGAAVGKVVFDAKEASEYFSNGEKVILVRNETSAEDIEGMSVSEGILTVHGGMTSHAAVVARGMGKCCVSGCEEISIFGESFCCKNFKVNKGDYISIDGSLGNVYLGKVELDSFEFSKDLSEFLEISEKLGGIKVMANADNPESVEIAIKMGAKGVGLCRTEHMFFGKDRINFMREMIIAQNSDDRKKALGKLFEFQKNDFYNMFISAKGKPVTIRLLDPPLHEFLPKSEDEVDQISEDLKVDKKIILSVSDSLKEFNPMMGHRGCRLLISYPEIAEMQVRAIILASIESSKKMNLKVVPEIMVPLVGDLREIRFLKDIVHKSAEKIMNENKFEIDYKIGTMIEVPRAALVADKIAKEVDFFSFGTNDLTQMTFGFSRDDAQKFLKDYYKNKIYDFDPFSTVDETGVGELMKIAVKLGRSANPLLKIGVCGEHAGDPKSIKFFKSLGLDYVSCSPFRIPVSLLASAKK
jgi:pyruvate,orthophosphate dikinase